MTETDLPTTAALILGAGLSTRFGSRKLLAAIDGQPMLQHVLDLAEAAKLAPVVVVLGDDAAEIEAACSWRFELRVRNPEPPAGIASSVRLGIKTLKRLADAQRAVVMMGDQPFLTIEQLDVVLGTRGQIIVPRYEGTPGNPVILDRSVWPLAEALQGDRGFSQLFSDYPNLITFVDVSGTNRDIDLPEDLREPEQHNRS